MKFILDDIGTAVNVAYIRRITWECSRAKLSDGSRDESVEVYGELTDGTYCHFETFEEGTQKENLIAAKKLVADLVNKINGSD